MLADPDRLVGVIDRRRKGMLGIAAGLLLAAVPALVLEYDAGLAPGESVPYPAGPGDLPRQIGPWVGRDTNADAKELARAGIDGFVSRSYLNRATGAEISVLLVWGPGGPLSVHTPDVCFAGAGYRLDSAPGVVTIPSASGPGATFYRGTFRRPDAAIPEGLGLYWAWKDGGRWRVAESPRLAFAGSTRLAKVYVARSLAGWETIPATNEDPCREFLNAWLRPAGPSTSRP